MTNEDYTCCRHQIDYYSALALLCYPKSRKKVRIVCRVALSIFLFFVKKKREQAIRLLSTKVVGRGIRRSFLFKILNCPTSVQHSRSQELSNVFNELHWKGFRFLPLLLLFIRPLCPCVLLTSTGIPTASVGTTTHNPGERFRPAATNSGSRLFAIIPHHFSPSYYV